MGRNPTTSLLLLAVAAWVAVTVTASTAASCVDPDRFFDNISWVEQQPAPRQLFCPLDEASRLLLQAPSSQLQWRKNCQALTSNKSTLWSNGTAFLTFQTLEAGDAGNYTCTLPCSRAPEFLSPAGEQVLEPQLGDQLLLNCTVRVSYDQRYNACDSIIQWLKDGQHFPRDSQDTSSGLDWFNNDASEKFLSSLLQVNVTEYSDYGQYSCLVRNATAGFTLHRPGTASHIAGVIAAFIVVLILVLAVLLWVKCRLDVKLWYRNTYGDYEMYDGKTYDAYVSYTNTAHDRKFVNFILKPHLENRYSYKLHLNDTDILPASEPSAELLMNVSRCRRLIVVLSKSYLEQDWCANNFREGFWRLMELSHKPIFIMYENQYREMGHPATLLLKEHKRDITLLLWNSKSMTPSSEFWKELVLVMPRSVTYSSTMADPQTLLQDDKDPMLTLDPDYLHCRADPDPEGDLGIRVPIYKGPPPRVSALPCADLPSATPMAELRPSEIDISDLGSRSYAARTDFYCLVTDEDV
ncbi:Single Ig IL-1-related receptor [Acipenser ruthenus]|uniref:Single Ig IL-1-related receptor n=1 Tax=Acipenser ruthenus TaxID=7906 RepID=A0A444UH74_ACIRT|nr:Single Ig IL-1-related receptor [Acipenser ruthenus]